MTVDRLRARFAAAASAALLFCGPAALAQAPAPSLDAAARQAAVQAAASRLRERYVFPDVGAQAAEKIEKALASGAYDQISDPQTFADRLTADLREVTKDKHLNIRATGPQRPPAGPPGPPPPRSEGGVVRADRLTGGIGYVEVAAFPPPGVFKPAVDRALAGLKDAPALIIDLRRNGGGSPQSVAYLVSHFVDPAKPMLINEFFDRRAGSTEYDKKASMSVPTPISLRGKPVYVLTSARTFSGGEEFAYDMQAFKLGVLVGETTGGGANPGGGGPLTPQFAMFTPDARPVNPVTKTNWEGVGVKPDIAVPAGEALKTALQKLGQAPEDGAVETLSQARLFTPRTTPQPGSESAVRVLAEGLASGAPKYEAMTPDVAQITRDQLASLKPQFAGLGAIQSISFASVGPAGMDRYELKGATGSMVVAIFLDAGGKVAGVGLEPPRPH
ncbi:S41 family peptidase [Phenylobacterium sp.]|jgi:hypothetical protein|uniref:S41 family peptidase n=1 Tax=Phenylobacterium sp. TaxID=1871053 RepID=UPI002F95817E